MKDDEMFRKKAAVMSAGVLQKHLRSNERSLEAAMARNARLMLALLEARAISGVGTTFLPQAYAVAAAAQLALTEANNQTAMLHSALEDAGRELGMSPGFGGWEHKDPPAPRGHLAVVEGRDAA